LCSRSEAISSPNENYSDELLDPNDARVLIQRLKCCNLLIIDDVGTSAMNTDARRDRVYDVLNCRIEDEDAANETPSKQNLVTSNLSDSQFIGATSERILSRLSYKSVVVSINSEDKRKKTMEGNYV
jgi:DNA replication protein DnaC